MPEYDVIVIGAGLGGLTAAALASRMDRKTILLEPGESVGGVLRGLKKRGFTFHPGPRLSFGFERGSPVQLLNERLGLAHNAAQYSPCYQVALPDRRITIYAEQPETLDELRREFPDEIDRIVKFYKDIRNQALQNSKNRLSAFLSARRRAEAFIGKYRFSPQFKAFLDVQSRYFFGQPVIAISLHSLVTLFDSSPAYLEGGFGKLAKQLLAVLLKNGGEIRYRVAPPAPDVKTRRVSTPDDELQAKSILFNREHDRRPEVLCVGVRKEVIPAGMLPEVICLSDYSRPDLFFTLSVSAGDASAEHPDTGTLIAEFNDQAGSRGVEARIKQVSRIVPFLEDFFLFAEQETGSPAGSGFPEELSWKTVPILDNQDILKHSRKGFFLLFDGAGTPCQSIAAAQWFAERTK